ncbi:ankyrin repeat family protein [Flamingopox virus FGPVKD09]|uniref:Ankyrin repeat family protein n=1 Tax=Flamingopox virus FGPVKD09 TaxID=2059380 RepID=A0A2H4X231_9POXV|nr:ankyrin repeat family protein [Flamingopox virus FGPVKD09]AUD40125.1 ankyrin repeat family protein [Flamingopox virus FGPVKD09]
MDYIEITRNTIGIDCILHKLIENCIDLKPTTYGLKILLHKAVELRNIEALKLLLNNDVDPVALDTHGITSLHTLTMPPNSSFIEPDNWCSKTYTELPEVINRLNKSKTSYAFQRVELMRMIMDYCKDSDISKCLTISRMDPSRQIEEIQIMDILLSKGIDPNIKDDLGNTALHYACDYRNGLNMVRYLIKNGADINIENDYGTTPLACAVNTCNIELVSILLDSGANPNSSSSSSIGTKVLHTAVGSGNFNIVKELIESGADPNIGDKAGVTPLHVAAIDKDSYALLELLLDNGADPNIKCSNGTTPLFQAMHNYSRVKLLFMYGADINIIDNHGNTPFTNLVSYDDEKLNSIIILQIMLIKKVFNDKMYYPPGLVKNLECIESHENLMNMAKRCEKLIKNKKSKDIVPDRISSELLEEEYDLDGWRSTSCSIS